MLSEYRAPPQDWATWLPSVVMALNSHVAEATGVSPHALVFGSDIVLPVDHVLAHTAPNVTAELLTHCITGLVADARNSIARAAASAARYANRSRRDVTFSAGELVLLNTHNVRVLGSPKL